VRPFGGRRLAAFALIIAIGVGIGAAMASADVRANGSGPSPGGGPGGGWVDARCKQPLHADKWYCMPPTTTTTRPTTTTTRKPGVQGMTTTTVPPPPTSPTAPTTGATPTSPPGPKAPVVVSNNGDAQDSTDDPGGDGLVALPPLTPPVSAPPIATIPGAEELFGGGEGVPLSMALVIAVAGLATVALVLRGTFGRGAPLPGAEESDTLKFR